MHLRSASVFIGYWNDPAATAEAIDADGGTAPATSAASRTGACILESRMRDLIIRGGENIYPIEIENRLIEHPAIVDAAVIGVAHPDLGQEVKAFVVLDAGASLSEDDVREWVGPCPRPVQGADLRRVPHRTALHPDRQAPEAHPRGRGELPPHLTFF